MDYYQGVVLEYLRADRSVFVNTECCIQLGETAGPDGSIPHWYCDALAVNFRTQRIHLCEISYSKSLGALMNRLREWNDHWPEVQSALVRDCCLPAGWRVRPWLFIPEECVAVAVRRLNTLGAGNGRGRVMPAPLITTLEKVAPWLYASWNRTGELEKPSVIPPTMRE